MSQITYDEIRSVVRENYGKIADGGSTGGSNNCCDSSGGNSSTTATSCCGSSEQGVGDSVADISVALGYSEGEVEAVPEGANLGLGCGNPQAIASLQAGEKVLDLGSGGGFDCFLAARSVGDTGHVIGVDMTPSMISRAKQNAEKAGFDNVEFRLGEIEHLPVADEVIDVILSNCVINLSPDKKSVFREAYRVLKPGGRLAISDIVATATLPDQIKNDMALYSGCMAGASLISDLESILNEVGFSHIRIEPKDKSREMIKTWMPNQDLDQFVLSATIEAIKPKMP